MTSIPLLVCCDAGAAGRELLARRDMVLRWALTPAEAMAVVAVDPPRLVLVRESMADDVLRVLPGGLPVVVLLEPDGWVRHQRFAEAGATALVRASNRERILEAVSELTGLAFRVHPRIRLAEVVSATVGEETHFVEAAEISASGIALRNLPGARVGTRVTVEVDFLTPPRTLTALAVRFGQDDGQPLAGLAFDGLTENDRIALIEFIRERESMVELPEPVDLTTDIGTYTLDLFCNLGDDTRVFRDMMSSAMFPLNGAIGPRMPKWLERVCASLTEMERSALQGAVDVPAFASAAIDLRLMLAQSRAGAGGAISVEMGHRVLEFSRTLANEGTSRPAEVLRQITEIRAAILVEAYAHRRNVSATNGSDVTHLDLAIPAP